MITKTVRAAKVTEGEREAREESGLLMRAIQDLVNGTVAATEHSQEVQGTRYTFRLIRPTAPDGGLVVVTWHCPGQTDLTSVQSAERVLTHDFIARNWPAECWAALEKISIARQRAICQEGTR